MNFKTDFSTYFDSTSPGLRGAVVGGLIDWASNGGISSFTSSEWKKGLNDVIVRLITSVIAGLPLQLLIDASQVDFLKGNKLVVTAAAVYLLMPRLSWISDEISKVTSKALGAVGLY